MSRLSRDVIRDLYAACFTIEQKLTNAIIHRLTVEQRLTALERHVDLFDNFRHRLRWFMTGRV